MRLRKSDTSLRSQLSSGLLLSAGPLIAFAFMAGSAGAEESPSATTAPAAGDAATWVSRLNSEDFDERNSASTNLANLGEAAREALEKGANGSDPEIKAAATDLLGKLSQATLTLLTLDRSGKPLPGVGADLTLSKEMGGGNQQPQAVTTKADGTELLLKTEPSVYNVYFNWKKCAVVGNFSYVSRLNLVPGPNRITVQLTQGGTCEARALDAAGKPLKDAKLLLSTVIDIGEYIDDPTFQNRFGGRPELTQSTDEKGNAKLENVFDGVYRLVWTHESCEPTLGPVVRIHEGQVTQVPDTTLTPKSRGSLQLTLSKEDGKPLEKMHFYMSIVPVSDDPVVARAALKTEYQQRMYDNGAALQQTDEKGKVTLENLKPGKFHILLRTTTTENQGRIFFRGNGNDQSAENTVEYSLRDIEIKAGAPVEMSLKPSAGSTLKGKIVNEKGEPCHDISLALIEENYLIIAGVQVFTQNYYDPAGMHSHYAQDKQDGTFEIKNLRPGKYALSAHGRNGESAVVYGIDVAAGKATDLPELKLPTPKKAFGDIKGKILLPTGAPAQGATVNLETVSAFGSSSSGINTNQKGEFDFNMSYYNMGYLPNRIRVALAGYHPVTLDLTVPDLKVDEIVVNLRKRDYGKLRVKTVDEAGKPMAGVQVWPTAPNANFNPFGRQGGNRMQRTNAAGEVHFKGLADGPRKLQIELNGYFTDPDATATVVAGEDESLFTATLHTGLKISGQLELPAGVTVVNANVVLNDHAGRSMVACVGADGKFTYSGLPPGIYTVAVDVPGCGPTQPATRLTLTKDQKEPANVKLQFVRNAGIVLNVGPAQAGRTAHLYRESFFKNGRVEDLWMQNLPNDTVDGAGRIEFIAPEDSYRVLVSDMENYYDPEYGQRNNVTIMRSIASVASQPLDNAAQIAKLEAKAITIAPSTGSVAVSLVPQFPPDVPRDKLVQPVSFVLVSSDILATFYYNMQARQQQPTLEPVVIGTPPKELQNNHLDLFNIDHLPPGDYKLYQLGTNSITGTNSLIGGKPLKEFSVKNGEKLELGELKFNIPTPTKEELEQTQQQFYSFDGSEEDQDKVEVFKP